MLSSSDFELCENEKGSCAENIQLYLLVSTINNELVLYIVDGSLLLIVRLSAIDEDKPSHRGE